MGYKGRLYLGDKVYILIEGKIVRGTIIDNHMVQYEDNGIKEIKYYTINDYNNGYRKHSIEQKDTYKNIYTLIISIIRQYYKG